jgi:hypothetical protein
MAFQSHPLWRNWLRLALFFRCSEQPKIAANPFCTNIYILVTLIKLALFFQLMPCKTLHYYYHSAPIQLCSERALMRNPKLSTTLDSCFHRNDKATMFSAARKDSTEEHGTLNKTKLGLFFTAQNRQKH